MADMLDFEAVRHLLINSISPQLDVFPWASAIFGIDKKAKSFLEISLADDV